MHNSSLEWQAKGLTILRFCKFFRYLSPFKLFYCQDTEQVAKTKQQNFFRYFPLFHIHLLIACSNTPFRKLKCYITLTVLKRGSNCCAVNNLRHGSLNLAFIHLKLRNTFIFGMANWTPVSPLQHTNIDSNNWTYKVFLTSFMYVIYLVSKFRYSIIGLGKNTVRQNEVYDNKKRLHEIDHLTDREAIDVGTKHSESHKEEPKNLRTCRLHFSN